MRGKIRPKNTGIFRSYCCGGGGSDSGMLCMSSIWMGPPVYMVAVGTGYWGGGGGEKTVGGAVGGGAE